MAGLVPFNRSSNKPVGKGFGDFYGMLDDFFSDEFFLPQRSLSRDTFKVDVQDKEKEYLIEAELPGVKKEEISLEIHDGQLIIGIQREERVDEEKKNYIHKERRYSSMSRSVYLADADSENIKAKLDDGVLTVRVPKLQKPEKETNKIEIE
ncbi:Hsp20/alpha crystallin family protein [Gudongella sp. DL1XJH-153]|uniref:Hsp20/alpha crystallin family protein n=1 Tax=Gudongella sp. DL1XJH-153 TaxID=3409804 RepID=UPI003BB67106